MYLKEQFVILYHDSVYYLLKRRLFIILNIHNFERAIEFIALRKILLENLILLK